MLATLAATLLLAAPNPAPVVSFHIGNSLTDTLNGMLEPMARGQGRDFTFYRSTIPGAPTDWSWNHPGGSFGEKDYRVGLRERAPITDLFTQPFAGHDRSIENEAEYSGRFLALARERSPKVRMWLYCQWPPVKFDDRWSQAGGSASGLGLSPAKAWQEGAKNHLAYTRAVARRMESQLPGTKVGVVPAGPALARLKTDIDAGRVPGMTDFFKEVFADDIHLTKKGAFLVAAVHYGVLFGAPVRNADPALAGLTSAQARRFEAIAWDTVRTTR